MKRILLIMVMVSFGGMNLTAQFMNWTLVNTGTTENIRDISFINRDTGFIAGDNGLLKMTTNGGSSWTDMTLPATGQGVGNNGNIKVAQFSDYGSGMIAGVLFFDKFTAINRTYNVLVDGWMEECGGSMFVQYDSVCSINNFHHQLSFTEYAAGGNCETGGGQAGWFGGFCFTFDSLVADTSFNGWMDVTSNVNDEAIFVGANGYVAQRQGFGYNVLNTGNGLDYLSVDWSDTSTVYAASNSMWYVLEKSTDGGNTFEIDSTLGPTFWYPVVAEIDFIDDDWGVLACASNGTGGVIITKKGNNVDYFNADTILTSVQVLDSTYAFAGGLGGVLYKYNETGSMGIDDVIENVDFSIFPNPQNTANDELNLFVTENVKEISIYDMLGKLVHNEKINRDGAISINTGIENSGTYIVRIFTNKGVGTKKYVVN